MKTDFFKKIIYSFAVLTVFCAVMAVLAHTAQTGMKTTEILPEINPEPVYVICEEGQALEVSLRAKEDFMISGFQVLLVNIAQDSKGTLRFVVTDASSEILLNEVIPVETVTPGKWFTITGNAAFAAGQEYRLSVLADASSPYFMQVPEEECSSFPFEEQVRKDGEVLACGISLGINQAESAKVTYGEIFYYSVPVSILSVVALLLIIWAGWGKMLAAAGKIPLRDFVGKYGNDLFLILLFGYICINIYSRAYLKGVYISADSAGYLREAVNLVAGNGFSYDGLAGYDTWFANWPILYPALIAAVMLITGTEAYLASKITAMVIAGLILLLLRKCFGKDAWLYGLCLTNIGYLNLSYYTWSEIPFILFLLCFTLVLAKILSTEHPTAVWYVALALSGLCCFLTRYYGIFVWIVTGLYLLLLFGLYRKKRDRQVWCKIIKLTTAALISGGLSMAYLLMNKVMNGMPSGVSRTIWWDDYRTLTDDLIESLLTEFFNIFSMQIPELVEGFPFRLKVFVVAGILAGIGWLIVENYKHFTAEHGAFHNEGIGKSCHEGKNVMWTFTRETVLVIMAVMYDLIFIAIRYVSSMDTFYFRFFEPATFLLCIGLLGMLLPYWKGKRGFCYFAGMVTVIMVTSVLAVFENGGLDSSDNYYQSLVQQWEKAYEQIPEKSVVIFNDIDFRSSYYRPDVAGGMITPEDEFSDLSETYYGSDYLCIRAEFIEAMLESGEYKESVTSKLQEGVAGKEGAEFVSISLN